MTAVQFWPATEPLVISRMRRLYVLREISPDPLDDELLVLGRDNWRTIVRLRDDRRRCVRVDAGWRAGPMRDADSWCHAVWHECEQLLAIFARPPTPAEFLAWKDAR